MATILKGFAFPIRFNPLGHLERATGVNKLITNMVHIIKTATNERNMAFKFGTKGHQSLFRNLNETTEVVLRNLIARALGTQEPRVLVRAVEFESTPKLGILKATIVFSVKGSGRFRDLTTLVGEAL